MNNIETKQISCDFVEWLNNNKYFADVYPQENGKYLYNKFDSFTEKGKFIDELFNKFIKNYNRIKKIYKPKCTHKDDKGQYTVNHSEWGEPFCSQCYELIRK